jgi:magnesium-transporting ATPase (P-type)
MPEFNKYDKKRTIVDRITDGFLLLIMIFIFSLFMTLILAFLELFFDNLKVRKKFSGTKRKEDFFKGLVIIRFIVLFVSFSCVYIFTKNEEEEEEEL